MESHFDYSDKEFESLLFFGTFPPEHFNHEAHLRFAWLHVTRYGLAQAIDNVCEQLKRYAEINRVGQNYNHTLTIAALKAVHHFQRRSHSRTFQDFIQTNPRLKTNFKELINSHYSTDIFTSVSAKQQYLEPDLYPFD